MVTAWYGYHVLDLYSFLHIQYFVQLISILTVFVTIHTFEARLIFIVKPTWCDISLRRFWDTPTGNLGGGIHVFLLIFTPYYREMVQFDYTMF